MKIGLVGYQGGGKSTVFELLTSVAADPSKSHTGQLGIAVVPDERYRKLVQLYKPKKESPAKIELFDTPGLGRDQQADNAQRLGIIREANALVHVVGAFSGLNPLEEVNAFDADIILADLQVVSNRITRLEKDVTRPRPDREDLQAELECLQPIHACLEGGESLAEMEFSELQVKHTKSFSLLTRKQRLVLLNTEDSSIDAAAVEQIEELGFPVVSSPVGLELEVFALPEEDRAEFAEEMGLGESCCERLLQAIFSVTSQITFFTCDEKEVHAWLLKAGSTAVVAADSIHSDLARGFIRADVMSVTDLIRLGSEREVKAAGLHHTEGKEYIVQDGDEIVIRSGI